MTALRALAARLSSPLARLSLVTGVMLLVALAAVSWTAAESGRDYLVAELGAKAEAQAESVSRKIERALSLGIPVDDLVGLDALHAGLAADDPHLAFTAIAGPDGRLLHAAGAPGAEDPRLRDSLSDGGSAGTTEHAAADLLLTRLPLTGGATLILGHDLAAAMKPIRDTWVDITIVLGVALALSFELMLLVITVNVILPARVAETVLGDVAAKRFSLIHGQVMRDEMGRFLGRLNEAISAAARRTGVTPQPVRQPRLVGVRLLAFLFVFAEELARPVMPVYFAGVAANSGADGPLAAGLVMTVPMLVIAIAMPLGSALYQQVSRLSLYVGGACFASIGLAGTALMPGDIWDLIGWRAISGLGYAATFVACQGFVIESTGDTDRARGTAMMVSGIMLADICGPAVGGIIAGHLGPSVTFLMGAGVALVAAIVGGLLLDGSTHGEEAPPRPSLKAIPALLGNGRLVGLLLLGAVPAKMVLTAFLFFLVPLALTEAGIGSAATGRVIMLYGLSALIAAPLLARLADMPQYRLAVVAAAGAVTGAGLMGAGVAPGLATIVAGVIALGVSQSLSIPAQLAAALDVSTEAIAIHGKGPVLAILRLVERLGAAAGPLLAAGLAATLGTAGAIWVLGSGVVIASALLLLLHLRAARPRPA